MADYDILVIGGGSGGLATAKQAASLGATVAIAESRALGGTCVNRGCVPKKLMVNAASFASQQKVAQSFHWDDTPASLNWQALQTAIQDHISQIRQSQQETLTEAGIDILRGTAQFIDAHQLTINDCQVTAHHVVIAVGGAPIVPDMEGQDLVLTSPDMFQLTTLPKHMAVVGGGYIGVEFSHILVLLGTQVTLIDTDKQVLSGFDPTLRSAVQEGLQALGVKFIAESRCAAVRQAADHKVLSLTGSTKTAITADEILFAVGRSPNLSRLNLERANVQVSDGKIVADAYGQTSQPNIYAVGDCVERLPLTPVAIAEGEAVARTICQRQPIAVDYRWIPSAVFGAPFVATVGWSEAMAQDKLGADNVQTQCHTFVPLSHSLLPTPQQSLIKLVIDRQTEQVVGVHMAGDQAPNMLQGLIPALRRGLTSTELFRTVGIHPTAAEEIFSVAS